MSAAMTFDTGAMIAQLQGRKTCTAAANMAAAQAAASQADALLDSLQVPRLATIPSAVNVVHASSSSSEGPSEKAELDSDDEHEVDQICMQAERSVSCNGK